MIRRKVTVIVAFMMTVCLLGGCGNSKSNEKAAEATTEAKTQKETPININAAEYVKLGQYQGLTIKGASLKVTDAEVQEELDALAQNYIEYVEIKDRDTVKEDDYLNVDYKTTINGKESDDYADSGVDIQVGAGNLAIDDDIDIDSKLVGAKVGDTVKISFTFPEDYDDSDAAGKKGEMSVSINSIEKEKVPELTDAFIKENTDSSTLKEYKKTVREELEEDKKTQADSTNQETLWNAIVNNAEQIKEFPDDIIETEVSNVEIQNKEWAEYMGLSVKEFIKQYYEMSVTDYAKDCLKKQCVQDLLVEKENVEVTDKDVEEEIQTYIDDYGYESKKDVLETISEDDLKSQLLYTKLITKLMKNTTVKTSN